MTFRFLIKRTILAFSILIVSAYANFLLAQAENKLIINVKNLGIEQAFKEIEKKSGLNFFYNAKDLPSGKTITLNSNSQTLNSVLKEFGQQSGLDFQVIDKTIYVKKKVQPKTVQNSVGDDQIITGVVVALDDQQPLQGVSVNIKNSSKAIVTDEKGRFHFKLTSDELTNGILVFQFIGYNKHEIKINDKRSFSITLEKTIKELTGVVVTNSYSKAKLKEEVVGSISTVSSKDLQTSRPIESFDKMLEGLVPGVQVITNTELGTPVTVNIRGQNALTNLFNVNQTQLTTSSQPLYIVDGVPIIEQRKGDEPLAFLNGEQLLNPLAGVNPDDIESISVLKDAAAVAIYGSNASNGVVIITTKKGRAGKSHLNLGYSNGWSQPINQVMWLNGSQYHDLVKELYLNQGYTPFNADALAGSRNINTPWFQLTNQYGIYNNLDVELSGGGENTQFRLSGSFLDQQSIQKGNDYKKMYFRLRIDHALSKKLNLSATLAPSITNKNALNVYSNVPIIPNVPAYNIDSTFYQLSNLGVPNPLAVLAQNINYHTGGSINGNIKLDYQPTKQLRFSTSWGIDGLINKQNIFMSPLNPTGASKNGYAQIYDRTNFSWINFDQVNWTPSIKEKHKFDITLGFEAQSQSSKLLRGAGSGFSYYRLNELSNAQYQFSASSKQVSNSYSVYGQVAYNYLSKYFINLSSRYDAASIFGPDINSSINSSIGLGWNISKEIFFKKYDFIDLFRLRLSYGTAGNSRIGSYQAKGIYTFNSPGYNGLTSASPSTAPNPSLTWETSYKYNVGLDFNFLKRFNIVLDFYQSTLDNAISSVNIPVVYGFSTTLANVATMRNRGFDGGIQAQLLTGKFKWTSILNFGYNKNIVLTVKNNSYQYSDQNTASLLKAGVSTSTIWGFQFKGADPQTGNPTYYDQSSGKVVFSSQLNQSMSNAYYLGDRLPDVQGGFINTFSYKSFSFTLNVIYSLGGKTLIDYNLEADGNNLTNRNGSVNLIDRWQKAGDISSIPKLSFAIPVVNSSMYVYDATFIKIGNASLAYTLPKKITDKLKGVKSTLFINGTNLFYWYKQKSPKDRNGIREYRFSSFPESQSFTCGIKLGL